MQKISLSKILSLRKGKKVIYGPEGKYNYLDIKAVRSGKIKLFTNNDGIFCKKENIVIARDGSKCGTSGYGLEGIIGSTITRLEIINPNINSVFLGMFIKSKFSDINKNTTGTAIPHVKKEYLLGLEIPLLPIPTQHRIVTKIEELFSKIDNGLQAMETLQVQLKNYKASVLKAAVEGKITAEWRDQNPNVQPASELLEEIKAKNHKKKIVEPKEVIDNLPTSWSCVGFNTIATIESNLVKPEEFQKYPLVAPDNIEKYSGKLLAYGTVEESGAISAKHLFKSGRIIYSKIRPKLSKLAIVDFEGLCSADMYPISSDIDINYLYYYMLSQNFLDYSTTAGSRTILPKINQKGLSEIPVSVPPLAEQQAIVSEVESRFSVVENVQSTINQSIRKAKHLKQSILTKAFSGELVDQLPEDGDVKELLKEIEEVKKTVKKK